MFNNISKNNINVAGRDINNHYVSIKNVVCIGENDTKKITYKEIYQQ